MTRLATGVKRLDTLMAGGLPTGNAGLLFGEPFIGKESLAESYVLNALRSSVPAIVVLTNAAAGDMRKQLMKDPSYQKAESAGLVRFVDTYSRSIGADNDDGPIEYLDGALDLNGINLAVNKAQRGLVADHDAHAIVMNSISTLVAYSNAQTAFRFLQTLIGRTRRVGATGLYLMDRGMHTDAEVQMFKHIMDGVVELADNSGKLQLQVQGLGAPAGQGWIDYSFKDGQFQLTGSFAAGRIR